LFDLGAIESIVLFGKPRSEEKIVEIGGGLGALTAELAALGDLTVVEIEPAFCAEISEKFPAISVVESDIRVFDLESLGSNLVVFGNLPYSLSTDIILYLVSHHRIINRSVVLLQKEFSERLFAEPGTKKYGTLSVQVQLYARVFPGPVISGDCFYPEAAVESQVVELRFLDTPRYPVDDHYLFSRVVSAAFFKRRKKLLNSVQQSKSIDIETFKAALTATGISGDVRAEDLSVEQFVLLANAVAAAEKQ
jgi:16S rRNA (adenine1518-N6/adenine1519-N6)-dimethyltransferase